MIGIGDIILRLAVAGFFGLLVGAERERRERAAGLRTMTLVSLGSALFTLVSGYAFRDQLSLTHVSFDPTRIMAQIVSGIGFLGAGVIWLRKDIVRGLTTAAALWAVAGVGMACGAGLWVPAITAIVSILIVLALLRPVERWIFPQHGPHVVRLRVGSMAEAGQILSDVNKICARAGLNVDSLSMHPGKRGEIIEVRCRISSPDQMAHVVEDLRQLPGVQAVRADVSGIRPARRRT